ncbi:hypothetical protein [Caudoviricetes sp.]|nr:hypothetical protein [Caudoviricetes sp.]
MYYGAPFSPSLKSYAAITTTSTVAFADMPVTTCCGANVSSTFWQATKNREYHCRGCDKKVKLRISSRREKTAEQWIIKPKLFGFLGYTVEHTPAKTYWVKVQKYVPVSPSAK